ncbi:hypothetical protein SGLAM104S_06495 [Streptomyces glaucescens]
MGDIMEQTVAGATSTGTHGTGRDSGSIAAQITALEMVTADGSVLTCSAKENPEVFAAARIGLGALGIVTAITFAVEPVFLLHAREEPMPLDRVLAEFDELWAENEHFEFYWFPHTGSTTTKRNNRSAGPERPVSALKGWFEDEFLSNGVFQAANWVGRAAPAAIPAIARISSKALSARSYTDIPYKVFTSPRRVRFVEMEYAVPREAVVDTLRELKAMVDRSPLRISFPVEAVRTSTGKLMRSGAVDHRLALSRRSATASRGTAYSISTKRRRRGDVIVRDVGSSRADSALLEIRAMAGMAAGAADPVGRLEDPVGQELVLEPALSRLAPAAPGPALRLLPAWWWCAQCCRNRRTRSARSPPNSATPSAASAPRARDGSGSTAKVIAVTMPRAPRPIRAAAKPPGFSFAEQVSTEPWA